MIISCVIILFLVDLSTSEDDEGYYGDPEEREAFKYNDKTYYFYHQAVSWEEAFASCESNNLELALLDSPGTAKFIAESIAEAWMLFEDMWIAARKKEHNKWTWEYTNMHIPQEPKLIGEYKYMYPPWINSLYPSRNERDCLAVDRIGHNNPLFVDLPCKVARPYICEDNAEALGPITDSDGVTAGGYTYVLYHGRLSWSQAVSYCRSQGQYLAIVPNITYTRYLAKSMLKSRPIFENAWIGLSLQNDVWTWVATGEEMKMLPAIFKDSDKGNVSGNVLYPQYPPWFEKHTRRNADCAVLDRHLCEEPTFVTYNCNRERDFICMLTKESAANPQPNTTELEHDDKRYIIFNNELDWYGAKQLCEGYSSNSSMVTLANMEETSFIVRAMSDAKHSINHIWLGGYLEDSVWWWINRSNKTKIPMTPSFNSFPPWCDDDFNTEMPCLNLDRENHWTPLIYGLSCNIPQSVICVMPLSTRDLIIGDVRVSQPIPESWCYSKIHCEHDIGHLYKADFNNPELLKALFRDIKQSLGPRLTSEMFFLDGGKYNVRRGMWLREDGQTFTIETQEHPRDKDCILGQISSNASDWLWFPIPCTKSTQARIICQSACSSSVISPWLNQEWKCDTGISTIFDIKLIGTTCTRICNVAQVSSGPSRFICEKTGWVQVQETLKLYRAGDCKDISKGLEIFAELNANTSDLVFITDSGELLESTVGAIKYFIGNLIEYVRFLNPYITIHAISMEESTFNSETVVIKVKDFQPSGECKQIRIEVLDYILSNEGCPRDFCAALHKVERVVAKSRIPQTVIVFITNGANQRDDFKTIAAQINERATIFAIGTNSLVPMHQLIELASKKNGNSLSVQFQKQWDIVDSTKILMKHCKKCTCDTHFTDYLLGPTIKKGAPLNTREQTEVVPFSSK